MVMSTRYITQKYKLIWRTDVIQMEQVCKHVIWANTGALMTSASPEGVSRCISVTFNCIKSTAVKTIKV